MNSAPARLLTLITAAVLATINLLALTLGWSNELVAVVGLVASAWIAVIGEIINLLTTPTKNVAMTRDEMKDLKAAGYVGIRRLNPEGDIDGRELR